MSEEDWQALAMKLKEDATRNAETGVDYSFYYRYTGTGASPRIFEGGGQAWAHQTYPKNSKLSGYGRFFPQRAHFSFPYLGFPLKRWENRKLLGFAPPPTFPDWGSGPRLASMVATPMRG